MKLVEWMHLDWKDIRVLITGASGFVGTHLVKRLLSEEAIVSGFDKNDLPVSESLSIRKPKFIKGDLLTPSEVQGGLREFEPEVVFHLAAISQVHYSFQNPTETYEANIMGTANLLDAIRKADSEARFVFAGSSEEYGLVFSSEEQYQNALRKYGDIVPAPARIPELPISEDAPLRPMSPYAISKVAGELITRGYSNSFGLPTVVSRAFNHEGVGRGPNYVTSSIIRQVQSWDAGKTDSIRLGNVTVFRDWSGINDVINGYMILAREGKSGSAYNQGSMRTNSVLTFLLWVIETAGHEIISIESKRKPTKVQDPTAVDKGEIFGLRFEKTKIDGLLLENEITFGLDDEGIIIHGPDRPLFVEFDPSLHRVSEVPIMLSDSSRIQKLGARYDTGLREIISELLDQPQ